MFLKVGTEKHSSKKRVNSRNSIQRRVYKK